MTELNKGSQSRELGNEHIREVWARCDKMNAKRKGPGQWAPWESVVVKPQLLPRLPDPEVIDRYAADFDKLPPITVQADTYVLIDGLHRLRAAPKAIRDFVLIEEREVADEDLAWEAFEANRTNASPYKTSERVALIKLVLGRHPEWSNTLVSNYLGLDPDTVSKHRRRFEGPDQVTENRSPATRLGADGKTYPVRDQVTENRSPARTTSTLKRTPVSSFTPDDEPSYEEPSTEEEWPIEQEVEPANAPAQAPSSADSWDRYRKRDISPETVWLSDFALVMEKCPFLGGRDLDEAIAEHPDRNRVRAAWETARIMAEVPA